MQNLVVIKHKGCSSRMRYTFNEASQQKSQKQQILQSGCLGIMSESWMPKGTGNMIQSHEECDTGQRFTSSPILW